MTGRFYFQQRDCVTDMKTPAERQKAVRDRRNEEGSQRRLNMWISTQAYEALSQLAREKSQTRMQVLDALLQSLAKTVTASQNSKTSTVAKPRKKARKPRAQIQFELPDLVTQSPPEPQSTPTQTSLFDVL